MKTTGKKFLPANAATPLMPGCEITLATASVVANNTDPAYIDAGAAGEASISCGYNGTDDTTARSLSQTATGSLLITFTTGSTASNIAQPIAAAAINKFALESNA
jgi:hypothetical protein